MLSTYSRLDYLTTYSKVTANSPNCNQFFLNCAEGDIQMDLQKPTDGVPEMKQSMAHRLCLSFGPIFMTGESS